MGCDIHCFKEKFVNGAWVTADEWSIQYEESLGVDYTKRFTDRNYNLFSVLSKGVRGEQKFSFEPRGLPFNVCAELKTDSDAWGCDGHSHSYLYLSELREMQTFLKSHTITVSGMKDAEGLAALQESIESDGETDWDLLYPYCKSTTDRSAKKFSVEVPAIFLIGHGLQKIIDSFEFVDGENHRIVFWFDN